MYLAYDHGQLTASGIAQLVGSGVDRFQPVLIALGDRPVDIAQEL
jgi:hypothetical protein